jgi:hypothetical protein
MSSLKQIEANRRNALKSTGPTTCDGKAHSRRNAVRHGLTAETVISDLEDAEDYKAFEEAVIADYAAETAVERELVLRLASVLWRLRRSIGIESGIFEEVHNDSNARTNPSKRAETRTADRFSVVSISPPPDDGGERDIDVEKAIASRFLRLSELPSFPLDRLSRYEHRLWRQARQLVLTLRIMTRGYSRRREATDMSAFPLRADIDLDGGHVR